MPTFPYCFFAFQDVILNRRDLCTLQIWALAVSGDGDNIATGGADSLVNLWVDCTVEDEEESYRQEVLGSSLVLSESCQ